MINILGNKCTGCGACCVCCPKQCISLEKNPEGFLYPVINEDSCVHCNLCEKVCPVINRSNLHKMNSTMIKGIKWKGKSSDIKKSASAGIIYALSKYVIQKGGVVSGAALVNGKVKHIIASTIDELALTQNSKYVQSYTKDAYDGILKILKNEPDKYILFTGTPCQCAAFRNLLASVQCGSNVYIIDFVCHGVPSPLLFEKYLEWLAAKMHENVKTYNFRCKIKGWNYHGYMSSYTQANQRVWSTQKDPYMVNFLKGTDYRESCYQCGFIKEKGSDITVADFGGVKVIAPDFFDKAGCSTVMEHTEKGRALLSNIINECEILEVDFALAARYNSHLLKSSLRPSIRSRIYNDINVSDGRVYVEKNLMPQVTKKEIIMFYIPDGVKRMLKKFIIRKGGR